MVRYSVNRMGKDIFYELPYDPMEYGFEFTLDKYCCFIYRNEKVQLTIKKDLQNVKIQRLVDGEVKSAPLYQSVRKLSKESFEEVITEWL